jgi:hypothetical protein
MGRRPLLAAIGASGALALIPSMARTARAEAPAPELLARLARHAEAFEAMRLRASFAIDGRLERLDGDGKVDGVKEMKARIDADGKKARFIVVKYVEDGEDKTDDARRDARERETKKDPDDKPIRMPFLAAEQPRYTFDVVERDRADPARVRITFTPRTPEKDTIEGSAWVDERTARVLSAGFKLSRPGTFVDFVKVTLRFEADTTLGPAVSTLSFEGSGGVLFIRKRFRGSATFSDYRIAPSA